jgi:hypothetical protein
VRETITKTLVEQAKVDRQHTRPDGRPHDLLIWDDKIAGFGLRVTATGTKSYALSTRHPTAATSARRWGLTEPT